MPTKSVRLFWWTFLSAAWSLFGWLATHHSTIPDVLYRYSWDYFVLLTLIFCLNVGLSGFARDRFYRHHGTIILLISSLSITLVSVEIYCRLSDPLGVSYFDETARYNRERVADPDLIFRHRPSWETTYQGVAVHFNERGLRDDTIKPKAPSEYRILALGDSVTFGWGVVQPDIFPARLQRILSAELRRPVRVINAGVAGYNTVQEHTFFRMEGLSLQPDLVVLLYHPNDIEPHPPSNEAIVETSYQEQSPPQVLNLLLEQSWLYRLVVYAGRYGRFGIRSAADLDTQQFRMQRGWKDSMNALREIARLCATQHIPMTVFYVRLLATPYNEALLQDVRAVSAPVLVVDMLSWFQANDKRVYMNSRMDPHLNSQGHQVVAEHMATYLLHENRKGTGLFAKSQ